MKTTFTPEPVEPFQILSSTTSHKREPLVPTLEVFARLGLKDLDLNLNHMVEGGTPIDEVRRALDGNDQRVHIVSGGWCDFFDRAPRIGHTFASVGRQVEMARVFGVAGLRLFFGRLPREQYDPHARDTIVANITHVSDVHPDVTFYFENHDGASSQPDVCREVLEHVNRPNVRMNFDPINFEHAGVECGPALARVQPLVGHVHLKGYADGQFCEFGEGAVDLTPILGTLIASGYRGAFTVEYEGIFDRTLRLYRSVHRAESVVRTLLAPLR